MTSDPGQERTRAQPLTGQRGDMNPGDQVPPDAQSAGENLCPACNGDGRLQGGEVCAVCNGSGKVIESVSAGE